MIKNTVIGVFFLVFVAALPFPAFADQSIGFQHYYKEGVKAYEDHDEQKALRYFKIAHLYDPADEGVNKYLSILGRKGVVLKIPPSHQPPVQSTGYRYYLSWGIKAFRAHDYGKAVRYFKIAKIYAPDSRTVQQYLEIIAKRQGVKITEEKRAVPQPQPQLQTQPQPQPQPETVTPPPPEAVPVARSAAVSRPYPAQPVPQTESVVRPAPVSTPGPAAMAQEQSYQPPEITYQPPVVPPANLVAQQNKKGPPRTLSLSEITNNGQINPKFQIEIQSSVIIEGKNILRYLVVQEGFIGLKTLDTDHLQIDGLKIGTTFLHIWDNFGRHTLYIEVVFPASVISGASQRAYEVQHAQPFRYTYSNDWSTFYSGKNAASLKRQSYEFNQSLGITGETPYGFFDAYGHYFDFNSFSQFDTYTVGLSQIPVEGTSNFDFRIFDSLRYLSPLTMPGTRLRGVFADIDLLDDNFGLSVSHGRQQEPPGFIITGGSGSQFSHSYIDAAKLTLFPKNDWDRYSFNIAAAHGPDRQPDLSDHVYSLEGQHKFTNNLTLNGELGNDSSHNASLASLKWQSGAFRTGLNFRDVDKSYSTISTLPAYQGEIGGSWVTEADFQNLTASTFVEAYRDSLYSNPQNPRALNVDANEQARLNFTPDLWTDSDINYVDTPGELSVQRSLGVHQRLSRSFNTWNSLKGTVFGGVGYQKSSSPGADISNFDREDVVAGFQLPLTSRISTFANYEYDWLNQPGSGGRSNPGIVNAGLEYQRQFNSKLSFDSQLVYRDELGVHASNSTFLSGEQSVIFSSSLSYNPTDDLSIFTEGNATKILSHIGNPSMDDFEIHLGMRITFGGSRYWDPVGTVSGFVFKDMTGNGKYVSGDEGIAGVKVKVGDKTAVTDKRGRYSMEVRAKKVLVVPVMDTIPGGYLFSTPQEVFVQIIQGRTGRVDFGLTTQTGIFGIVFVDKNGTGVPGGNDKFVGKVRVILDGKTVQRSDNHGAFYFRKVTPGTHVISIDINSLDINMIPLVKLENKIDVTEGTNYMFNVPVQVKDAQGNKG